MKLVLYARKSDPNAQSELGLDAQIASVKAWADKHGHTLIGTAGEYVDHHTGASDADARPGLASAIARCASEGADGLVAARRDRLGRGGMFLGMIQYYMRKAGATPGLYSADGTGNDERDIGDVVQRAAMDMFAEIERFMITMRFAGGKKNARARGRHVDGPPAFGYRKTETRGILDVCEDEARIVRRIFKARDDGRTSDEIADDLTRHGARPRRGDAWNAGTLRKLLTRRAYYCVASAGHPAILEVGHD